MLLCEFCFQADAFTGSEHAMCTVSQVHSLQIALSRAGFSCHEEEEEWWQFGDTTFSALITFQARSLFAMDEQGQLCLLKCSIAAERHCSSAGAHLGLLANRKATVCLSCLCRLALDWRRVAWRTSALGWHCLARGQTLQC